LEGGKEEKKKNLTRAHKQLVGQPTKQEQQLLQEILHTSTKEIHPNYYKTSIIVESNTTTVYHTRDCGSTKFGKKTQQGQKHKTDRKVSHFKHLYRTAAEIGSLPF
jgi:hypothetical protein